MKIILASGGTGGHIFPAMALAEDLREHYPADHLLFVGGNLANNRFFDRTKFNFHSINCGTFANKNPKDILVNFVYIVSGVLQSLRIIKKFKPNLIVGFGSFYTLPVLLAAKLLSIPFILHEANSIPGKVNRLFSRYALWSAVFFPKASTLLKGKVHLAKMPMAKRNKNLVELRLEAERYFGILRSRKTLLVFGGSQGARNINENIVPAMAELASHTHFNVLHFCGCHEMASRLQERYNSHNIHAYVKAFETRMDLAWAAADYVISRSGAGTVTEQLDYCVPGIQIPYPHAADNHQAENARFLSDIVKGGLLLHDHEVSAASLSKKISQLLSEGSHMQQAMINFKKISDVPQLSDLLRNLNQE